MKGPLRSKNSDGSRLHADGPSNRPWAPAFVLVIGLLVAGAAWATGKIEKKDLAGSPPQAAVTKGLGGVAFAPNESCVDCHQEQASAWQSSHHAMAMQEATVETVLGDFQQAVFKEGDASFLFFKGEEDDFRVRVEGAEGDPQEYRIAYTFGVHPLQQYLIELPGGRLQALTVVFDVEKKEWYSLYPGETISSDQAFSFSGRYQNWNVMCAECHSTAFEKNYDAQTDTYSSTWAEINVSCQACHGPGEEHAAWALAGADSEVAGAGLVGQLAEGRPGSEIETCAVCHSRRHAVSPSDTTGGHFLDDFVPETLDEGLYEPDGQILEEVYVHGSFLQSRMYAAGVTCTDCHDPHGLNLVEEGDALCTRCHGLEPDRRFPQLAKRRYDTVEHHHHKVSSPGARCVSCHMPTRTYMGVDVRHDHAFQVPRPDLADALGTRNVCTGCHQEKTSAWAAQVISDQYGPSRTRGPHWARAIDSARRGEATALESLLELTEAGAAPDIVRATAVKLAARYGAGASGILLRASQDSSPLVRNAAAWAYSHGPDDEKLKGLPALLSDPYRSVRAEAGRGLASFPLEVLGQEVSAQRDRALSEYVLAQESLFDLPSGRFNQAVLHVETGEYEAARSRYAQTIAMDPRFLPAIANLAQLESALGERDKAERVLRTGLEALPGEGELHYSLGLLLAEKGDIDGSASALAQAAVLLPQRARVQYNHGLAEQHLGHIERAAAAFRNAAGIEPLNPAFVRALAILYAQNGRWFEANMAARSMMELAPDSPENRALFQRIQSELKPR